MSEDYKDKDPEKLIFRTALNSMQIEPSEKFWNSALHGIIDKQNAASKKRVQVWKGISIGLGVVILFFCLHDVLMNNRMDKVQEQVAEIKNNQEKLIAREKSSSVAENNNPNKQRQLVANAPITAEHANTQQQHIAEQVVVAPQQNVQANFNRASAMQNNNRVPKPNNNITTKSFVANEAILPGEPSDRTGEQVTVAKENEIAKTPSVTKEEENGQGDVGSSTGANKNKAMVAVPKTDSVKNAVGQTTSNSEVKKSSVVDTASILVANIPPKPIFNLKNKLSASAFFGSGVVNEFMKDHDNNSADNITPGDIKSRQNEWYAYQFGFKLGYDITNRLKLQTGVYYSLYKYSIGQTTLTTHPENNEVGYSMVTSTGVVDYSDATLRLGDTIKCKGSSSRGYVCIPLQLSYTLVAHNRLGFYVIGGVSANIATYNGTSLHWWDATAKEGGDASVGKVPGLCKIQYCYNFGFGLTYKLGKGLSLYAEPCLQGSLTSINKDAPVTTYPFFFGGALGLTYHL